MISTSTASEVVRRYALNKSILYDNYSDFLSFKTANGKTVKNWWENFIVGIR